MDLSIGTGTLRSIGLLGDGEGYLSGAFQKEMHACGAGRLDEEGSDALLPLITQLRG